jgi:predicted acylesterase/phospholipase RssA
MTDTTASASNDAVQPFRVLALDGGGIRGYYTARLLSGLVTNFEKQCGRGPLDLGKGFDLIVGTSTGGILGAGLAAGKQPAEIAALYRESGPAIFPQRFTIPKGIFRKMLWIRRHWDRPDSCQSALAHGLAGVFGDLTLADVWARRRIAMAIPTVSIENYGPKVFKTPHDSRFTHDLNVSLVDVCLATSAAPLFFPLHPLSESGNYFRNDLFVDGGLWANNPSLVGLIEAIEMLAVAKSPRRPIHIYSIGTCAGPADQSRLKAAPAGGLRTWMFGKDITELTLATSAHAMGAMTDLLAHALTSHGLPIMFSRLPDPEMTSQQHATIGMDKADDQAFQTMESLAATNETRILSDMKTNAHYQLFTDLLRTLPETGNTSSHVAMA